MWTLAVYHRAAILRVERTLRAGPARIEDLILEEEITDDDHSRLAAKQRHVDSRP